MAKFKRVKRCEICGSKLDDEGNCTWKGCPKNIAKQDNQENDGKEEVVKNENI